MRRIAWIALAIGFVAAPAAASEVVVCQGPQGQASSILYYVRADQPAAPQVRYEYIDTGATAGIIFDDGTGPHKRVVHEFRTPIVQAICDSDRAAFEQQHGITTGPQIQGELFQLLNATTNVRVGTVFIDQGTSGVQATGGGISVQQTYSCLSGEGVVIPTVVHVRLIHGGFDTRAIDGAAPATIQREYLAILQRALGAVARAHMSGCTAIGFDEYVAMIVGGKVAQIHYDNGDPGPGVYRAPQ